MLIHGYVPHNSNAFEEYKVPAMLDPSLRVVVVVNDCFVAESSFLSGLT